MSSNITKLLSAEVAVKDSIRTIVSELTQLDNSDDALLEIISTIPELLELARRLGSVKMPEHVTSVVSNQAAWWFDESTNTIEEVSMIRTAHSFGDFDKDKVLVLLCSGSVATVSKELLFYTQEDAEKFSYMRQIHDDIVMLNGCRKRVFSQGNILDEVMSSKEEE